MKIKLGQYKEKWADHVQKLEYGRLPKEALYSMLATMELTVLYLAA
jgi:hypothetical protein